jgi:predicted ABC-type ATPase
VKLVFLSLPSADMAVARVAARVQTGGHNVPEVVVRRRFDAGLRNFHTIYRGLVNNWEMYDNTGAVPQFLQEGANP